MPQMQQGTQVLRTARMTSMERAVLEGIRILNLAPDIPRMYSGGRI